MGNSDSTDQGFERYNVEEEEEIRKPKKPPKGRPKHRRVTSPTEGPIIEEPDSEDDHGPTRERPISATTKETDGTKQQSESVNASNRSSRPPPVINRPKKFEMSSEYTQVPVTHDRHVPLQNPKRHDSGRYRIEYTGHNQDINDNPRSQKSILTGRKYGRSERQRPMEKPKGYVLVRKDPSVSTKGGLGQPDPKTNVQYSYNMTNSSDDPPAQTNTRLREKPMSRTNVPQEDADITMTTKNTDSRGSFNYNHGGIWMP